MAIRRILAIALLATFFVSCGGGKKKVTNVEIDQSQVGQDVYLHLSAELDLGNIYIPTFSSDVNLPGRGLVGDVTISSTDLQVNILASAFLPRYETLSELPNGAKLPLIKDNPVVVLPVGHGNKVKLYVSLVNGAPSLGVTFLVHQLDAVKKHSAVFPPFMLGKVGVSAGVFTSEVAGESGIGAFFDLKTFFEIGASDGGSGQYYIPMGGSEAYELNYSSEGTDKGTQKKIDRVLYDMHRKRAKVELY